MQHQELGHFSKLKSITEQKKIEVLTFHHRKHLEAEFQSLGAMTVIDINQRRSAVLKTYI